MVLVALAGGGVQSLATALLGDVTEGQWHGRALGLVYTFGDLSSTIAPPLVYTLLPLTGLPSIYLGCAGLLAVLGVWAAWYGFSGSRW